MSDSPRFLLDGNVPKSVKRLLESRGFQAEYAGKGVKNSQLITISKERTSILVSRDADFLNISLYPPKEYHGIVVFQIHPPKAEKLVRALSLLLEEIKDFSGKLFVLEEDGFGEAG